MTIAAPSTPTDTQPGIVLDAAAPAACCAPSEQATCCEPTAKATCCGPAAAAVVEDAPVAAPAACGCR